MGLVETFEDGAPEQLLEELRIFADMAGRQGMAAVS